jgi:hypothetical protein
MVQATFDDLNPETRNRWRYADTQSWDADRNTREFIAAMPAWRRHGLLAVTVNLGEVRRLFQGSAVAQPGVHAIRGLRPGVHLLPEAHPRRGG